MHKGIYKIVILSFIFVISVILMSGNIKEQGVSVKTMVEMEDSKLPLLYITVGGYEMNRLHGYNSNIDANVVREAMTPIHADKTLKVRFAEKGADVRKVLYEVRELKDNELLDSGEINALSQMDSGKETKIKIGAALVTGKEYAMKITASLEDSTKIHYFTRIKYYETNFYLDEKINFVMDFHKRSLDKQQAEELKTYLEPDSSVDNSSFAKVTIHSSFDNFSWGNLKPQVITEVVPTIKEFNTETAAIQLSYYVKAKTASGEELYLVEEFYRIRYTQNRIYLLNYERTMESVFDINLTSMAKSEFKAGITQETAMKLFTSGENNNLAFVRQDALWYYDLKENRAVKVFAFLDENKDYLREGYDQHEIRILDMDEEGNIDFIIYGYMNSGEYEGKVALILYRFTAANNQVEELVYVPLETTYQMLKEEVSAFSYVSANDMFYFTVNSALYCYDIVAKQLNTVAIGINENNFAAMIQEGGHGAAWVETIDGKSVMTILNLETGAEITVEAQSGESIQVYGNIGANLIYGYVKNADITETKQGTVIRPAYHLEIVDVEGNVRKTYKINDIYVTDVEVNKNIARLLRVKKVAGKYVEIAFDSILSQGEVEKTIIKLESRVTDAAKTEWYISLPSGFAMTEFPIAETTKNAVLREETTLYLELEKSQEEKYYVYAYGKIIATTEDVVEAILMADANVGVVVNHDNRIVWERGGRLNYKTLGQIKKLATSESVDSIGACLYMVLHYNHIGADAKQLTRENKSIYNVLKENLQSPINLTGATLDEVLYFVSSGSPVIAMKDANNAVLITGYDESSITVIDPQGHLSKVSMKNAEALFKDAGNIFISYIN